MRQYDFDVLLCAQASLRSNALYPFIKAKRKIGFDIKRSRDGHGFFVKERIPYRDNHLIEGFAQFFEYLGLELDLTDLRWPISNFGFQKTLAGHDVLAQTKLCLDKPDGMGCQNHPTRRDLGLVVAASKAERTWPLSHQVAFVLELMRSSAFTGSVILLGGNSSFEVKLAHELMCRCQQKLTKMQFNRLRDLVGQTTLNTLPAIIADLGCLVAPDTGPVHLARALNVPVVGLYAVARPGLSGPYGSSFTIDAYPEAAKKFLGKSLDQLQWHDRVHHSDAMSIIGPMQVLQNSLHALSTHSRI